jgi:hypothetical protein
MSPLINKRKKCTLGISSVEILNLPTLTMNNHREAPTGPMRTEELTEKTDPLCTCMSPKMSQASNRQSKESRAATSTLSPSPSKPA